MQRPFRVFENAYFLRPNATQTKKIRKDKKINYYSDQADCLNLLGELNLKTGNFVVASEYLNRASKIAAKHKLAGILLKNYQTKKDLYLLSNNQIKAIPFFQKIDSLKDTIHARQQHKTVINANTKYETERKEKENEKLRLENQLKEETLLKQNITILSLLAGGRSVISYCNYYL